MFKLIQASTITIALCLVTNSAFAGKQLSSLKCAASAADQAETILRFHYEQPDGEALPNHTPPTVEDVTTLPREKHGSGEVQVLSVFTGIYKASYVAVLKYAEIADASQPNGVYCLLMSQQITDLSNPF